MKKWFLIALGALLLLLCSCKTNQGDTAMNDLDVVGTKEISVTFVNGVEDADIWILPQTDENLGTTLWGTPTLKDSVKDTIGTCRVEGGAENYIVRIIDADEAYYAASDFILLDGYTVRFTSDTDKYDAALTVIDENGSVIWEQNSVFIGVIE